MQEGAPLVVKKKLKSELIYFSWHTGGENDHIQDKYHNGSGFKWNNNTKNHNQVQEDLSEGLISGNFEVIERGAKTE